MKVSGREATELNELTERMRLRRLAAVLFIMVLSAMLVSAAVFTSLAAGTDGADEDGIRDGEELYVVEGEGDNPGYTISIEGEDDTATDLSDQAVPLAASPDGSGSAQAIEIDDELVPLAASPEELGGWSITSLILMILTCGLAVMTSVQKLKSRGSAGNAEQGNITDRKSAISDVPGVDAVSVLEDMSLPDGTGYGETGTAGRIAGILMPVIAIGAAAAFFITADLTAGMKLTDSNTMLMAELFIVQLVAAVFSRFRTWS